IAVVREKDVRIAQLQLLDVPVDLHFRSALRIYDFDSFGDASPRQVRVRIYDMCGIGPLDKMCSDVPFVDTILTVGSEGGDRATNFPDHPSTRTIGSLVNAFPQLLAVPGTQLSGERVRPPAVRIAIDPISPGLRFWAFVSATNNETQHEP